MNYFFYKSIQIKTLLILQLYNKKNRAIIIKFFNRFLKINITINIIIIMII